MLKIKTKCRLYTSRQCCSPKNLWKWHTKARRYKILFNMLSVLEVVVSSNFSTFISVKLAAVRAETTRLDLHLIKESQSQTVESSGLGRHKKSLFQSELFEKVINIHSSQEIT